MLGDAVSRQRTSQNSNNNNNNNNNEESSTTPTPNQPPRPKLPAYDTIVLLLSTGDLIISTSFLFQPVAIPQGTPGAFWAHGNTASCSVVGFIAFFGGQWVAGWNCFLAVYFLLVVRYRWNSADFYRSRLGRNLILTSVTMLPLATSCLAIYWKTFNFSWNSYICNIGDSPDGCYNDPNVECTRGQNASIVAFAFVVVILIFSLTGFACTFTVYCTVRTWTRRSLRHTERLSSFATADSATPVGTREPEHSGNQHPQQVQEQMNSSRQNQQRCFRRNGSDSNSLVSSISAPQKERLRQTAWQAVFYSLAYFNVFFWPFTTKVNNELHGGQPGDEHKQQPLWFTMLFLTWLFYPLQGFFNFFIFIRPDMVRWRKLNPQQQWIWVFKHCVWHAEEPAPRNDSTSRNLSLPPVPSVSNANSLTTSTNNSKNERTSDTSSNSNQGMQIGMERIQRRVNSTQNPK